MAIEFQQTQAQFHVKRPQHQEAHSEQVAQRLLAAPLHRLQHTENRQRQLLSDQQVLLRHTTEAPLEALHQSLQLTDRLTIHHTTKRTHQEVTPEALRHTTEVPAIMAVQVSREVPASREVQTQEAITEVQVAEDKFSK